MAVGDNYPIGDGAECTVTKLVITITDSGPGDLRGSLEAHGRISTDSGATTGEGEMIRKAQVTDLGPAVRAAINLGAGGALQQMFANP